MKIKILLESMPEASQSDTMVDKCRSWVKAVEESGIEEAASAWDNIRRLQNKLMKVKNKSDMDKTLLRLMAKVVKKYATFDPKGVDFDATYLNEDKDA